jgi:hypothetical protein
MIELGYKLSSEEQSPGPEQKGVFEFYAEEILPNLRSIRSARRAAPKPGRRRPRRS